MPISVDDVSDEAHLRRTWRSELRPVLRSLTFRDPNLATDPLAYVAYDWGLDLFIQQLADSLRRGSYVAEKAEIVRSAKAQGLSRPVCFLTVRDALVYRAITNLVGADLTRGAREYVAFLRSEKGGREDLAAISVDSFDWFSYWLEREGQIARWLEDDVAFVVESDIANFYPSIRIDAVREHLHSVTNLSKEVVRLCVQLIDGVMPRTDYSENSMLGLPQESVGASREIAHSLLLHVDTEFAKEGKAGHYARFMDDIMIGVASVEEGERCVARLQRALETLGLYPNAAKTRIDSMDDFLEQHMVEANSELERFEEVMRRTESGNLRVVSLDTETSEQLRTLARSFRDIEPRPRRWDRVMRRFYTVLRRAGQPDWWDHWQDDLRSYPGSAPHILEHVRSWPLTLDTVDALLTLSRQDGVLYPSLSVLTAETVAHAPNPDDPAMWHEIAVRCESEVDRLIATDSAGLFARAAASWAVAAFKFADDEERAVLIDKTRGGEPQSPVRDQGLAFHIAAGEPVGSWLSPEPGMTAGSALNAEYLRRLQDGDERAVRVALNVLKPQRRFAPLRYCVPARALTLLDCLGREGSPLLLQALPHHARRLKRNETRLRDHRLEACIDRWIPSG